MQNDTKFQNGNTDNLSNGGITNAWSVNVGVDVLLGVRCIASNVCGKLLDLGDPLRGFSSLGVKLTVRFRAVGCMTTDTVTVCI